MPLAEQGTHGEAKWILSLLAGAFLLPVVLALGLYASSWRPATLVNHGLLVQPPRPLGGILLRTREGKPVELPALRGKWALVYVGPACPQACQQALYKIRQVRSAMGKDTDRVQRVFVATDSGRLESEPGLIVLFAPHASAGALARAFGAAERGDGRIGLVDPLGNLVMNYGPEADPGGMRRDLARLLRYSWVG